MPGRQVNTKPDVKNDGSNRRPREGRPWEDQEDNEISNPTSLAFNANDRKKGMDNNKDEDSYDSRGGALPHSDLATPKPEPESDFSDSDAAISASAKEENGENPFSLSPA